MSDVGLARVGGEALCHASRRSAQLAPSPHQALFLSTFSSPLRQLLKSTAQPAGAQAGWQWAPCPHGCLQPFLALPWDGGPEASADTQTLQPTSAARGVPGSSLALWGSALRSQWAMKYFFAIYLQAVSLGACVGEG